jgi:hypothetical protein
MSKWQLNKHILKANNILNYMRGEFLLCLSAGAVITSKANFLRPRDDT